MSVKSPSKREITDKWGEQAYELLKKIKPPHVSKKRYTLLKLADQRLGDLPLTHVFKMKGTCSKDIHYQKWMKDERYRAAYDFLIGDNVVGENGDGRGVATQMRDRWMEAELADYTAAISTARRKLILTAPEAIGTLIDQLEASHPVLLGFDEDKTPIIEQSPDNSNRRLAANSLLDRVPELAKNQKVDHTTDGEKIQPIAYIVENRPDE